MLKELFEASFYITFPKKEDKVLMLEERMAQGDFSLVDDKACQGCKYICSNQPEERVQLKAHSDKLVSIVSLDQVFDYVREDVGEISDPENQEMDSVETSMKGMILMSDEVYSPDNESKFDFGFKMKEIRFPDVLICR